MFQSEQLQEKWKPLLEYDGLDPIKDNHRKAVTAVLLENQEKFLREEQAFGSGINLMEAPPTNAANAAGAGGGFGGGSGGRPGSGFTPVDDTLDSTARERSRASPALSTCVKRDSTGATVLCTDMCPPLTRELSLSLSLSLASPAHAHYAKRSANAEVAAMAAEATRLCLRLS